MFILTNAARFMTSYLTITLSGASYAKIKGSAILKASLAWLKHRVPANPAVQPTVWPLRGPIGLKQSPSAGVDTPQLGTENFCSLAPASATLQTGFCWIGLTLLKLTTPHADWANSVASPRRFHDAPLFYYETSALSAVISQIKMR